MSTEITDKSKGCEVVADDRPIVLWDDHCNSCRRLKSLVDRRLECAGYRFESLWRWRESRSGFSADEMHLVFPDGRRLGGIDALLHLMRRVWWLMPVALLGRVPGIHGLMRWAYRWFAARRYRFGCACEGKGGTCKLHEQKAD